MRSSPAPTPLAQDQRDLEHELAETNGVFRELEDTMRPRPPTVPGIELAGRYSPTGGDLYDWFVLPDGRLHVTLFDAVGHGVTSTRHALTVTHAIRTLALEGHPFTDLIARTARIVAAIEPDLMATVLLARIDPATGETTLANGSHPEPVLVSRDGCVPRPSAAASGSPTPVAPISSWTHSALATRCCSTPTAWSKAAGTSLKASPGCSPTPATTPATRSRRSRVSW